MTAARAIVAVSGKTPDGVETVINGEEALRTLHLHPDLARITKNTATSPPQIDVTPSSLVSALPTDLAALTARVVILEAFMASVLSRFVVTATGAELVDRDAVTRIEYGVGDGNLRNLGFFAATPLPQGMVAGPATAENVAIQVGNSGLIEYTP